MSIRFGKTTRGRGKIYTLVHVDGAESSLELTARSFANSSTEVPAKLLPHSSEHTRILILPVLDVVQRVTILGSQAEETPHPLAEQLVRPLVARLESAKNTLLKDADITSIRNYDALPAPYDWKIVVDRMIPAPGGLTICQGQATIGGADRAKLEGNLQIDALGRSGQSITHGEAVIMRDSILPAASNPDFWQRTVQFSFRIGQDVPSYIVWVRPAAAGSPAPGFVVLEDFTVAKIRKDWAWLTTHCYGDPDYNDWYTFEHAATPLELEMQRRQYFPQKPVFSIVVPLFRTPLDFLAEMADSVLDQTYSRFELILVNASPEDDALSTAVAGYASRDKRIRVVTLTENLGITENTNAGIAAATGDFICFLDHDDTLAPDALYCYAKELAEHPETDLIYCDEDHLDGGRHTGPFLKPDWNPDLLLGMNYICHFLCVRKAIVDALPAATREFDGSQDHHMALRVSEQARRVGHVPRILYHWRIHPGSTADNEGEKSYALEAGRLAVQAHLDRTGANAHAVLSERIPGRYEVVYDLDKHPLVSVIIPNKDNVSVLDRCLQSIREITTYDNYEVVIVENNSTDQETFAYYERATEHNSRVRVVTCEMGGVFNYPKINNYGAREAKGDYLLFLNNDTEVIDGGWMERMVGLASRPGTGAVGVKLLYPDNTVQHAGVVMMNNGPGHAGLYLDRNDRGYIESMSAMRDVSVVTAACLMSSREAFEAVGGMSEEFAVNYNDVDYCLKLREKGFLVVLDPGVELYHYESISRGFDVTDAQLILFAREKGLLRQRWPQLYALPDPYYNPNLDQFDTYYRLGK